MTLHTSSARRGEPQSAALEDMRPAPRIVTAQPRRSCSRETLFNLSRCNLHEGQDRYRGERQQEYYLGQFWVPRTSIGEVRSERFVVGPVSIIRQTSSTRLFFRRTQQHIREDGTDLSILWFTRQGRIQFSDQQGLQSAGSGDFAITRSTAPFLIECQPSPGARSELLHVTVPTHVLRTHIPQDLRRITVVGKQAELSMAERIFTDVFESDALLQEASTKVLIDTALTLIGVGVRHLAPVRLSVQEIRLQELLGFMERNLTDPALSISTAAAGCSISKRYLSYLLNFHGRSFSQIMWQSRLSKAAEWLISSDMRTVSITEIAYSIGFKSPAHFSRMFKRTYGLNPRDFRTKSTNSDPEDEVAGNCQTNVADRTEWR